MTKKIQFSLNRCSNVHSTIRKAIATHTHTVYPYTHTGYSPAAKTILSTAGIKTIYDVNINDIVSAVN